MILEKMFKEMVLNLFVEFIQEHPGCNAAFMTSEMLKKYSDFPVQNQYQYIVDLVDKKMVETITFKVPGGQMYDNLYFPRNTEISIGEHENE